MHCKNYYNVLVFLARHLELLNQTHQFSVFAEAEKQRVGTKF
jgi:hypothetical protein